MEETGVSRLCNIYDCFGVIEGNKFILIKLCALFLKKFFIKTNKKFLSLGKMARKLTTITDKMVEKYIFQEYEDIYKKYENMTWHEGEVPEEKIIWTAWLQGFNDMPQIVKKCIESLKKNSNGYEVKVITLKNIHEYIEVNPKIYSEFKKGNIKSAHFTDYIRMKLLRDYGGIWQDATHFMIKPLDNKIWNPKLLVWNKIYDVTDKKSEYIAIPFVEGFNNSFLVGKKGATFYEFALEITEKILLDKVIKFDYFANFKAYFAGKNNIAQLSTWWEDMPIINPYGMVGMQLWNKPVNEQIKKIIENKKNYFFKLTYKKEWVPTVNSKITTEEFIMENF